MILQPPPPKSRQMHYENDYIFYWFIGETRYIREVSPTPFMINGLPIPAAVREILYDVVRDRTAERYL